MSKDHDEHIHVVPDNDKHADRKDCWCEPVLNYKDEVTGREVYVHKSDDELNQ